MAKDVEALVLQMSADVRRFEKSMDGMRKTADRRLAEVERRTLQSQKNLSRMTARMGDDMVAGLKSSLGQLAPTIATAFSAAQVIRYADSYTALQNRLRAAGLEGQNLQRVEEALYETANRNGLQVQATAELYSRASLSRERLGASEEQLLALVSGTAAALKVQGTSAEAASGPLLQLGQALSGANVQAEEYNSLIDGLPVLLQAAAKGSDRFGGDVAKLTEQVKAGKVSSQEFFQALLGGFPAIEKQAGASATTIGSALQTLDNQLGRYIGQADGGASASARMAQGIEGVANNLDKIIPAVTVLATLVGGRYVLSMTAATSSSIANAVATANQTRAQIALIAAIASTSRASLAAGVATNTFTAALAANPLGAVLIAATALAAGIYLLASRYSSAAQAARELDRVTSAADTAISDYAQAVDAARNASASERDELLKKAEALKAVTQARIADARVAAQKQIDEATVARSRADASIAAAGDRRAGQGERSFSNASVIQDQAASRRAQTDINYAVRALREAADAQAAVRRLEAAARAAGNGSAATTGGIPPAATGGGTGGAGAASREIERLDELRRDLARIEDDLLTDTERAVKELAEKLAIIKAAVDAKVISAEQGARLGADLTGQDIRLPTMDPLEPLGTTAQDLKQALDEGAAEVERAYRQAGDMMARDIVDVLASDDIWQAAGWKFREAAFENLQALLSDVFTGLFRGDAGPEGGLGASIVKGIGALFGKRALGGPARAGQPIVVGERRAEVFVPNVNGTVIPSVNAAMAQANRVRSGSSLTANIRISLDGANGDEAVRRIAYDAARAGSAEAVRQSVALSRRSAGAVQQSLYRLGTAG